MLKEKYIQDLAMKGKRMDGRGIEDFRKIEIETGLIENAEGSARVRMGKTEVIAGVKLDIGEPFPDRQGEGVLMAGAEFSPLASPDFETGPPREDSIELARVVDRGIRESKMLDMKKLCIKEGEKVWMVFVDIQIINHDGNLIDCASLASVAALLTAKMPKVEGDKVDYGTKTSKGLPITCKPVAVTFWKVADKLLVDASVEEEEAAGTRLTVTTKDSGNICAMQKGGREALSVEEIEKAFDASVAKGKEMRKLLDF